VNLIPNLKNVINQLFISIVDHISCGNTPALKTNALTCGINTLPDSFGFDNTVTTLQNEGNNSLRTEFSDYFNPSRDIYNASTIVSYLY
jgi:hypothetical protein